MIATIIILAYVANVFLNRWLNKILYISDKTIPISPFGWFIPCTFLIIYTIIKIKDNIKNDWFLGKNW